MKERDVIYFSAFFLYLYICNCFIFILIHFMHNFHQKYNNDDNNDYNLFFSFQEYLKVD